MDSGEDSKDIFVHINSLKGLSTLSKGQRVRFSVGENEKGPCAVDVEVSE